jgi:hypothetical protein
MVEGECEFLDLAPREPSRLRRVVAAARLAPDRTGLVQHRNGVAAGIALRVRVDAEKPTDPHLDARLLGDLARPALLRRLSHVTEAAREGPPAPEGRASAPDKEEAALAVPDPGVHGQTRPLRSGHDVRP